MNVLDLVANIIKIKRKEVLRVSENNQV